MNLKPINQIIQAKRFLKTWIILGIDTTASFFASALVILLIYLLIPEFNFQQNQILVWLPGSAMISLAVFWMSNIYRSVIRYSTLRALGRIFCACAGKEILLWLVMAAFSLLSFRSMLLLGMVIIDFFITLCLLALIRATMILIYDTVRAQNKNGQSMRRVLVYGTGDKAAAAVSRLRHSLHYHIEALIEYGEGIPGQKMLGMNVCYFKNAEDVINQANRFSVSGILFPYIADARAEQDRLITFCRKAGLRTYILPTVDEMTEGSIPGNSIRKIKIEDLLGRDEINIPMNEIISNFRKKTVMVTGAAGSIGAELCRLLATFGVKQLILYDNAETPLHNIRMELEDCFPNLNFMPIIGDVRSETRLDYVFRKYRPDTVFHAAAYKHVPLMEENPCEAILVNVTGSRLVADKCVEYGAEKMVMVSTDKAVNPTNIMGCSKRLAEIYVQSLGLAIEHGEIKGNTKFVTTRFGNVLGSNGSVILRFREQIEHGGPITVTHPDILRFFMTIPEACRLVIEAATFATGTQIFVFDMGQPVKIATLAERMINLAGLEVGRDIKIKYMGLRPGEKLFEEVLATKENTIPTCHDRIFIAKVRDYSYQDANNIMIQLNNLATLVAIPEMVRLMKKAVPEFKSKNSEYEKFDK